MHKFIMFSVWQNKAQDLQNTATVAHSLRGLGTKFREVDEIRNGKMLISFIVPYGPAEEDLVKMFCREFNQERYLVYEGAKGMWVDAYNRILPAGKLYVTTQPLGVDYTVLSDPSGVCYEFRAA